MYENFSHILKQKYCISCSKILYLFQLKNRFDTEKMHSPPAVKATSYVAYFAPIRSHTFCFGLTHTTEMKNNNATSTFYLNWNVMMNFVLKLQGANEERYRHLISINAKVVLFVGTNFRGWDRMIFWFYIFLNVNHCLSPLTLS